MTKANLGELWYLFEDHQFHNGQKHGTNAGGYTFDNEARYINGPLNILIKW